ncbi:MAG: hypothetical protein KA163_15310, partial [Bacteroidia bacterium]|nr:hypothetical protein [Bacteroidia bacterium]
PPGNNQNPQTIEINESAWPAHQAHGDTKGACPEQKLSPGKGKGIKEEDNDNGNKVPGRTNKVETTTTPTITPTPEATPQSKKLTPR